MPYGNYEGAEYSSEGGRLKQESPMQVGFSGCNFQRIAMISTNVQMY